MNEKAQIDDTKLRQIEEWAEQTYMQKLRNVDILDKEDGLYLVDLAIKQADRESLEEYVSNPLKIPGPNALNLQGSCISQDHAPNSLLFLSRSLLASYVVQTLRGPALTTLPLTFSLK